jgi:hypothetical protein
MIFEVTFCIVFILTSRAIAKIYYRRRDVLYGPYRATVRCRRSKADELEHLRAPVRPDITPSRVRRRVSG